MIRGGFEDGLERSNQLKIGIIYGANKAHADEIGELIRGGLNLEHGAIRDIATIRADDDLSSYDLVIAGLAILVKNEIKDELQRVLLECG